MVRFVRNPTVNWTDLDSIDADRESQYSKQMLKEMIERKRRNDFVRRREFDQLRKLRKREALQGQRTEDPTARPSFFQSSMASPDDRAVTLKKIDEIEAQMSQQWWKSKNTPTPSELGDSAATATDSTIAAAHDRAFAPTAPASLPGVLSAPTAVQPLFSGESLLPSGAPEGPAQRHRLRRRCRQPLLHTPRHRPPRWPPQNRRNSCTNPTSRKPPSALPMATMPARSPACSKCWPSTSRTIPSSSWRSG